MTTRRRFSAHNSSRPDPPSDPNIDASDPPATPYYDYDMASKEPQKGPLHGKIALVTGATGGIGTAICSTLAALGCSIGVHYNTDQDAALKMLEKLKEDYMHAFGSKFVCYGADLGNYEEVKELHEHIVNLLGPPNILINNHGAVIQQSVKSIDEVPISTFEDAWRINCGSSYYLTQLCLPAMEGEGWGRVVFVSSVAGITGGIIGPHYASAKSALHGLIHWLAMTYAKKGITVNGVAPALIADTKMLPGTSEELSKSKSTIPFVDPGDKEIRGAPTALKTARKKLWVRASDHLVEVPVGRLGTPHEIANTVLWMINTSYVTNKIIAVDGGIVPQH